MAASGGRPDYRLQRANPRRDVRFVASLMSDEQKLICFVLVANISEGGAKLLRLENIDVPERFTMVLSTRTGLQRKCGVVWQSHEAIGVRFLTDGKSRRRLS
ncbi:MAG TPA: PilZ domain-containing protein [Pseudolabrys sp.]